MDSVIKSAILYTVARQILGIFVGFGSLLLISRFLGAEGYGIYTLAVYLVTFLVTIFNFGTNSYISYGLAKEEINIRQAFWGIVNFSAITSFFGSLLALAYLRLIPSQVSENLDNLTITICIMAFPILLFNFVCQGIFQGLMRFKELNSILIIPSIINLLLCLLIHNILGLTPLHALASYILSQLVATFIIYRRVVGEAGRPFPPKIRLVNSYSAISHASNVVTFINYRFDNYIVIALLGIGSGGVYALAIQIAERLWIVANSISQVIFPVLTKDHSSISNTRRIYPLVRLSFYVTLILAICINIVVRLFDSKLFDKSFTEISLIMPVISIGILAGSISKVISNNIAAMSRVDYNLKVAIAITIINISLSIYLTRNMGITGACIATSVSYVVDSIMKIFFINRENVVSNFEFVKYMLFYKRSKVIDE